MNTNKKTIKSSRKIDDSVILGTFEGECLDADITNLNGLDIPREVWEYVFNSDDYKKGIEYGWYIGFLGHPEDPNCMDFRNACIVLRECYMDDNGKLHGKFDLIDTPVGQVVLKFIKAGVKFGISVRGAGDIEADTVVPETFVFRGFDLVSFPAFPESIPEFQQIAASTDPVKQKRYQAVCAAVNTALPHIDSVASLNIIRNQFAKQSKEYKNISAAINTLESKPAASEAEVRDALQQQRITAMVDMYMQSQKRVKKLADDNHQLKQTLASTKENADHKILATKRLMNGRISALKQQVIDANAQINEQKSTIARLSKQKQDAIHAAIQIEADSQKKIQAAKQVSNETIEASKKLQNHLRQITNNKDAIKSSYSNVKDETAILAAQIDELTQKLNAAEQCNKKLKAQVEDLSSDNSILKEQDRKHKVTIKECKDTIQECQDKINTLENNNKRLGKDNLLYKRRVEATTSKLSDSEHENERLSAECNKTVEAAKHLQSDISNRDRENRNLQTQLTAARKLIDEYQDEYVKVYSNAIGIVPGSITVTSSTSVSELQSKIVGSKTVTRDDNSITGAIEIDQPITDDNNGDELITA